ncbi:MAG: acyl--CoA ligase [Henriciella sp.]|nr:acyl--CoA ligase [Henriciella sp.]MBO6695347.1 acyl--CoA ligase [Henriciella sp.]
MYYEELAAARDKLTGPGGDFEIIETEILGNKIRDFKNSPNSIRDIWLSTAQFAERTYLVYEQERISYRESHRQVSSVAGWLSEQGVRPGDRVAVAMRNYPEWMLIYWACTSIGVAVVGMNAWWTKPEMAYGINDAAPKLIFADAERLARIIGNPEIEMQPGLIAVRSDDTYEGVLDWADIIGSDRSMPDVKIDPDSDACIFYTSGTTGFPKGAQLTHRGCVANLLNMQYAAASSMLAVQAATGVEPPATMPVPVSLITTPLFHVTANNCGAYRVTAVGGTIVLMYRWDAGEALRLIERERVTSAGGVPVMGRELINHPDFDKTDTSSLLAISCGGAQVPPDQVQKIDDRIETARPGTGYGMTETCGIITSVAGDFFVDKPDSAGPAMPNFEVKCVDDAGNEVPVGELGELWVRGSSVIKGYINRPEATAESITDGWLHTGDIARLDEHDFIYLVDRKKDMVLRGGENIYCVEVEAAIYHHPAVAECCVFGVPDERLGEEVGAAVYLKPGETLSVEDLQTHCAGRLAKFKIPTHAWICPDPFPRNASGKFLKREVREQLISA